MRAVRLTVTGGGTTAKRDPKLDTAVAQYRRYAQDQADETLPRVETFVKAVLRMVGSRQV